MQQKANYLQIPQILFNWKQHKRQTNGFAKYGTNKMFLVSFCFMNNLILKYQQTSVYSKRRGPSGAETDNDSDERKEIFKHFVTLHLNCWNSHHLLTSQNVEVTVVVSKQSATAAVLVKSHFRITFSNKEGNDFCGEYRDAEKMVQKAASDQMEKAYKPGRVYLYKMKRLYSQNDQQKSSF